MPTMAILKVRKAGRDRVAGSLNSADHFLVEELGNKGETRSGTG
jgi:hypothetical protein